MELNLNVTKVEVEYGPVRQVEVNLSGVDLDRLIDEVGRDVLLDSIGKESAIEHFDIEEAEDEA